MTDTTIPAFQHDHRWSPGASNIHTPGGVVAHYSGRWIDRGGMSPADVVHDRQGIGYTHQQYALILQGELRRLSPHCSVSRCERDVPTVLWDESIGGDMRVVIGLRRAGGYVYCDAYLAKEDRCTT